MPITQIMANLADKTRALGTHWWNPPHLIPLVEVIRTALDEAQRLLSALDDFAVWAEGLA